METANFVISVLAGLIGSGMLMYAKSAQRLVPMGAGLGLLIIPYFISNVILMLCVCTLLGGLPFVYRE